MLKRSSGQPSSFISIRTTLNRWLCSLNFSLPWRSRGVDMSRRTNIVAKKKRKERERERNIGCIRNVLEQGAVKK
uniref:Uncharacterized protein n=1 Tax=Populus trichocarpa TaxID=3694 RepID=A0A2K2ARC6_POPTR